MLKAKKTEGNNKLNILSQCDSERSTFMGLMSFDYRLEKDNRKYFQKTTTLDKVIAIDING